MLNTLKTFSEAIIDKVKTFNGDWSENDQSSPNYIKNKTHWVENSEIILYNNSPTFKNVDVEIYAYQSNSSDFLLELNQNYVITFDEINYSCKSVNFIDNICIGNLNIVESSFENTGEPFVIIYAADYFTIATRLSGTTHTVTIKIVDEIIHKLDKKYLPDNYLSNIDPIGTGSFSLNRNIDTTIGNYSFAEGYYTTASGNYSHSEGNYTSATNNSSHAEGSSTTASGRYSHAEGYVATASNSYSHAEGHTTTSSGEASHAEGYITTASGNYSHAEGGSTKALGNNSHAEGSNTTASGSYSHAEGNFAIASGNYSHAEGNYTKASSKNQHAQGKFNIEDASDVYADIIGNGSSNTNRSNAATIDWSGNAWFAGDIYAGSTSGTNKDSGSKKIATEEYVTTTATTKANSDLTNVDNTVFKAKIEAAGFSKPVITSAVLLASNWDSATKTYSFESDFPSESYNIEVEIDGDTCTTEQLDAWVAAKPLSSTTSKINAKGDIPTIDIPVIITSTLK